MVGWTSVELFIEGPEGRFGTSEKAHVSGLAARQ